MSHLKPRTGLGALAVAIFAFLAVACDEPLIPEGFQFSFSPKEVTIPAAGGSAEVAFNAPIAWEASTQAAWIQISPSSGEPGDVVLQVTVGENPDKEARSAEITVSLPEAEYTETIQVTQEPSKEPEPDPTLTVSTAELNVPYAGGSVEFSVSANVEWSIGGGFNWLSVSPDKGGAGDTKVVVTVSENKDVSPREETISVQGPDNLYQAVKVKQAAAPASISISMNQAEFSSAGGTIEITVEANTGWEVTSGAQWATVRVSGNTATLSVAANDSTERRSCEIVFKAQDATAKLSVSQKGKNETGGITGGIGDWGDGGDANYGR